jgi:hypothetical protein
LLICIHLSFILFCSMSSLLFCHSILLCCVILCSCILRFNFLFLWVYALVLLCVHSLVHGRVWRIYEECRLSGQRRLLDRDLGQVFALGMIASFQRARTCFFCPSVLLTGVAPRQCDFSWGILLSKIWSCADYCAMHFYAKNSAKVCSYYYSFAPWWICRLIR